MGPSGWSVRSLWFKKSTPLLLPICVSYLVPRNEQVFTSVKSLFLYVLIHRDASYLRVEDTPTLNPSVLFSFFSTLKYQWMMIYFFDNIAQKFVVAVFFFWKGLCLHKKAGGAVCRVQTSHVSRCGKLISTSTQAIIRKQRKCSQLLAKSIAFGFGALIIFSAVFLSWPPFPPQIYGLKYHQDKY